MQFLKEMMEDIHLISVEPVLEGYDNKLKKLHALYKQKLDEGVLDFNIPQVRSEKDGVEVPNIEAIFGEASKRLEAARRALGLANKLPPGESRTQNKRRIMGNLNRIRDLVYRLQMQLGVGDEEMA